PRASSLFTLRSHPSSTRFPYTTLFRSLQRRAAAGRQAMGALERGVEQGRCWDDLVEQAVPQRGGGRDAVRLQHQLHRPHIRDLPDRKSTRLNSSHVKISYAVFCLKKKI